MKNIFCRIVLCLLTLAVLVPIAAPPLMAAETAETKTIDQTTAYEDIADALADGKAIDMVSNFSVDKSKPVTEADLITIVEAGYKKDVGSNSQTDFALYVYIYCPSGSRIITSSAKHTIMLATAYDTLDAEGKEIKDPAQWRATDYKKFTMTAVNMNDDAVTGYSVFPLLKFKVNVTAADLNNVVGNSRRYDISEFELHYRNASTATAFTAGHYFVCSGYQHSATMPHTMTTSDIEVIPISVKQTYFRYANQASVNVQTQVNTVYFAIDKAYWERFDTISAIKAEWFEVHSSPIVVTSDEDAYTELKPYIGKDLSTYATLPERSLIAYDRVPVGAVDGTTIWETRPHWVYNTNGAHALEITGTNKFLQGACNKLAWLIPYAPKNASGEAVWQQTLQGTSISTQEMLNYFETYLKNYGWNGTDNTKLHTTGIVGTTVDEGRIYGKQEHVINGKITLDSFTYSDPVESWLRWLLTGREELEELNASAIQKVEQGDLALTAESLSKKYLVTETDIDAFTSFCNDAYKNNQVPVVFHFAVTDYFAKPLGIRCGAQGFLGGSEIYDGLAYVAKETVFLDFDIIYLDFVKAGVNTIIPVKMSPVNIVPGVEPSPDQPAPGIGSAVGDWFDKFKAIFAIVALVLIVVFILLLVNSASTVFGVVGKGASAVAKGISKQAKKSKQRRSRRKKK